MSTTRDELHRLVDLLPEETAEAVRLLVQRLLKPGGDPLLWALLTAPEDDEAETPEEAQAVQEAREGLARGETITDEQLRHELGL